MDQGRYALHAVTDAHGRVTFSLPTEPKAVDWSAIRATLHLPLAACTIPANRLNDGTYTEHLTSGHEIRCTYEGDTLHLSTHAPAEETAALSWAVVEQDPQKILIPLQQGYGEARLDTLPDALTLRWYL